jgi:hypothetical protein
MPNLEITTAIYVETLEELHHMAHLQPRLEVPLTLSIKLRFEKEKDL